MNMDAILKRIHGLKEIMIKKYLDGTELRKDYARGYILACNEVTSIIQKYSTPMKHKKN